ncbi:MAG: hypothetical protein U0T74_04545 [Chitinophagales bacterium]
MKLKSIFPLLIGLYISIHMPAQKIATGSITFSCETGDKFTLYVGGVKQNETPALIVEAKNISSNPTPCTIEFQNIALTPISGNINRTSTDALFSIIKDNRGNLTVQQKIIGGSITTTTTSNTSSGTTVSGTSSSGNTTTVKTNGSYVESVKSGEVEATDHSVKTDKFSVSSNVSVKVKTPGPLGDLPSAGEINSVLNPMGTQQTTTTTTTTTTTSVNNPAPVQQTNTPGTFYFESEGIDSFYLWFNGRKINETPQMHVEIHNVTDGSVNMRVEFSDRANKPCSKSMIRWGRDCYYTIQRNNKGEHIIKLKNAVGNLTDPAPQPVSTESAAPSSSNSVSAAVPGATFTVTTNSVPAKASFTGPLQAELKDGKIMLNDGRVFKLSSFAGNSAAPQVKASILAGSKYTITYADALDTYQGSFPLEYTIPKPEKYNQGFTLTVDEGGADKTWGVKIPSSTWKWITISQ